jgi:uncharacterized protein (TIGR03437 family)
MQSIHFNSLFLLPFCAAALFAQSPVTCVTSAVPPVVRSEGLTERIGDINFTCTGPANTAFNANITIALNANITNHLSAGSTLTGIVFTTNMGAGPQAVAVTPLLIAGNSLVYNGVPLMLSSSGSAALNISGIRTNATQVPIGALIIASIAINGANLPLTSSQLVVGTPLRALYVGFSDQIVCAQNGSPLPSNITFASLIQRGTAFASTRITEGFADAFGPLSADANFNADFGQRIIIRYSGFPGDARLFIPDVVAGSNTVQPTAGGDFRVAASAGAYQPTLGGTLLLARVAGADANGAGGTPVYTPGPIGSGVVAFSAVSELAVSSGGTAYAVYEVVDANKSVIETAQFPTWLGLLPNGNRDATQTSADVFLAATSTVGTASTNAPIPRFLAETAPADCVIVGDCSLYYPHLAINSGPLALTGVAGGATQQTFFTTLNTGGGHLPWTSKITYTVGSGWLTIDPASLSEGGGANVRVYASPAGLTPGTYTAAITIDAGPIAGAVTVPVSFTVTAPVPKPSITSVVNAASFQNTPVVPGSISTVMGKQFTGKSITVTFDGMPATVLFSNDTQINVLVPAELASKTVANLGITVDGESAGDFKVNVAPFSPAIFPGAVLNQDYSVNAAGAPAKPGSVIQIFATGLSGTGTITAHIHDRDVSVPYYAGPAPGLTGVQQVDLVVPQDLTSMKTEVYVCGDSGSGKVCSLPAALTIQ